MTDNIRLNLDQAFQENPDRYARDRIIGRSFGIPPRLLDDNDRSIYRAINNEKVMEGLTTARHFYSNYDNAVLAQDDSENLANIEKAARLNAVRQWGEKNRLRSNEPGIIRENAAAVWAGLRMFTNNIDLLQANYYARELERREKDANDKLTKLDPNSKEAQLIRTDLDNVRKHLRERISGNVDEYQEDVTAINKLVDENTSLDTKKALEEYDNIHDTWDTVKFFATHPRATIYTGAQSFGGMLPTTVATAAAVAAAPFTGGASLAVGAGTTALGSGFTEYNASLVSKLQEAAKDGDITSVLETPEVRQQIESEAFRRGATIGTVEGLTMGLTGVVAKFASSPLRAAVYGTGVEVAAGSIGEAAGQIADQGKITSPRDIVSEGLLEIATGAPEVGLSIAKYGKNQLAEINTADVQNLQHMAQAAQQSKLGERAPDVFEDFVRKAAEDADSSHLYIDGNALHQSGLDEALIKTDPSFTDRIAEAVETGGAVQIPLEEFLTKIAPNQDIVTRMQEHTRFQPDGLSMQEIREHAESEINDALKQAVEKAATEEVRDVRLDAVKNDILEQLNQVNRFTPETNALYAALPASFYDVYSQRAGMTIDEFLAQNAIRIVGETNDGGLNQALESHPPEGWVHAQTGEETSKLWRGDSDAKAVFWTEPAYRLSEELPQITGYSYSISADALEHIRKQHSNAETEVKRGQIGITEEDIARIPEIINNYGAVRDDLKSLQGSQRLMLAKRFEDGTIVYLVQPSRKKKDLQGVTMWKYPPAVDEQRALEIAITSNQTFKTEGGIFHKGNNTPSPETKQEGYHQAIRAETREQYERRIDELFAGGKAKDKGITILDRSDILDMFGLGDTPVRLVESKVLQGMDNHREMTAEVWKKIPDWLENPAAVFDSDTEQGRLVVIAPELVNGEAVRIILSPSRNGMDAAVVVNAYGGNRKAPYSRWMNDRLLRYADTKRAPQIDEVFGRRLPDVLKNPDFQPAAQIHGMGQGNRKSSGRTKILTEKNLAGYRKNAASLKQNSSAQNPVLERGSFLPDSNTIVLTPHANLSTFIHETGHFFFETLTKMARQLRTKADAGETLTASQQQIVQDADTLLAHVGFDYEKWDASDLETRREAHEKAARGFEQFIMEGKAPSVALQGLFSRMRAWLLHLYKSYRNLDAPLSDEVRQVFNRMLASDETIQAAELNRGMSQMFTTAEEAGMTPEQFAEYQRLGQAASDAAMDEMQAKVVRDNAYISNTKNKVLKRLQREAKEEGVDEARAQITEEVQAEVMAQPSYRVWRALSDKGTDTSPALRLNPEDLREMGYSEEQIKALGRKVRVKDSLHPDVVAEMLLDSEGNPLYESGDAMVQDLLASQPPLQLIKALVDQRMLERFGELSSPQAMARAADMAAHNDIRLRLLATEFETFAKGPQTA